MAVYTRVRRGGTNSSHHRWQVLCRHAGNANGRQVRQRHRGDVSRVAACGCYDAGRRVSHGLQLGQRVCRVGHAGVYRAVKQVQCVAGCGNATHAGHAHCRVLGTRQSSTCVGSRTVGAGKNSLVRVDDGLHFSCGVCGSAVDRSTIERAVDRSQVAAVHARDTSQRVNVGPQVAAGSGVAVCGHPQRT